MGQPCLASVVAEDVGSDAGGDQLIGAFPRQGMDSLGGLQFLTEGIEKQQLTIVVDGAAGVPPWYGFRDRDLIDMVCIDDGGAVGQ